MEIGMISRCVLFYHILHKVPSFLEYITSKSEYVFLPRLLRTFRIMLSSRTTLQPLQNIRPTIISASYNHFVSFSKLFIYELCVFPPSGFEVIFFLYRTN